MHQSPDVPVPTEGSEVSSTQHLPILKRIFLQKFLVLALLGTKRNPAVKSGVVPSRVWSLWNLPAPPGCFCPQKGSQAEVVLSLAPRCQPAGRALLTLGLLIQLLKREF